MNTRERNVRECVMNVLATVTIGWYIIYLVGVEFINELKKK